MAKTYGKFTLSLTGKDSHKVNITPGQGRFTIAPKTSGEKADAYVGAIDLRNHEMLDEVKVDFTPGDFNHIKSIGVHEGQL